jgi:hypothetical protein
MKKTLIFLLIINCVSNIFTQTIEKKIVVLPFEIVINEYEKIVIKENGFIEFDNKEFLYNEYGMEDPIHEALVTIFIKNNLCGINILEQTNSGGVIDHTFIINTKTKKEISYEKSNDSSFWGFFSINNNFILTYGVKAYVFNDLTGELLWTQTYKQRNGKTIIYNGDYLIIDDIDGNKYRIYGDGRKLKL